MSWSNPGSRRADLRKGSRSGEAIPATSDARAGGDEVRLPSDPPPQDEKGEGGETEQNHNHGPSCGFGSAVGRFAIMPTLRRCHCTLLSIKRCANLIPPARQGRPEVVVDCESLRHAARWSACARSPIASGGAPGSGNYQSSLSNRLRYARSRSHSSSSPICTGDGAVSVSKLALLTA